MYVLVMQIRHFTFFLSFYIAGSKLIDYWRRVSQIKKHIVKIRYGNLAIQNPKWRILIAITTTTTARLMTMSE